MYLTQKTYNKPNLPPLSSLLKEQQHYKLPSIDTFYASSNVSTESIMSNGSTPATPLTTVSTPILPIMNPIKKENQSLSLPGPAITTQPIQSVVKQSPSPKKTEKKVTPEKKRTEKAFAFISHSVQTFPSQEPSIDNAPLARRKRRRTSPNELNILNQEFMLGSTPNKLRRIEIANKVSMTEKAVQIWFQNKRQSIRKQSNSQGEITVLPPTDSIANSPDDSINNSSIINSMNNSINNSINNTVNSSIISSTPIKPSLNKSQSFSSPDSSFRTSSPIKQRSSSASSIFSKPIIPIIQVNQSQILQSTPNKSSSFEDSLVLNETKKKNHSSLSNVNNSMRTFKLGKFKVRNDNKENPTKRSKNNKIQNLLNNAAEERKPLAEISNNKRVNEGVQSLLSLREGNWR